MRAAPRRATLGAAVALVAATASAAVLAGSSAHAQPSSAGVTLAPELLAQRRLLIEQAQRSSAAGDHAAALERARQAEALQPSPSLAQLIAAEEVALGRYPEAMRSAARCISAALANPATPRRDHQIQTCRELVNYLTPRVGQLTVQPAEPIPSGLVVRVDAQTVPPATYGLTSFVAPGRVVIEAQAPGHRPYQQNVQLAAGASARVEIALEPLPLAADATVAPPTRTHAAPPRPHGSAAGALPWIVTGLGGAGLLAAGALDIARESAIANFEKDYRCQGDRCADPAGASHLDALHALNTWTNVALIGGAVVLAGGVAWLVAGALARREAPQRPAASRRVRLEPIAAAGGGGAMLGVQGAL